MRRSAHCVTWIQQSFCFNAEADPEFALIISLIGTAGQQNLAYDVVDTVLLLRWNELVADGRGLEELPPLRRRGDDLAVRP